jgi:hypothetical protein
VRGARLAFERAERLRKKFLRVGRFDGEQSVEELGHRGGARARNDLFAQRRERVERVAVEENARRRAGCCGLRRNGGRCRRVMHVRRCGRRGCESGDASSRRERLKHGPPADPEMAERPLRFGNRRRTFVAHVIAHHDPLLGRVVASV